MKEEYTLPEGMTFEEAKWKTILAILKSQLDIEIIDNNGKIKILQGEKPIATFTFAIK